MRVDLCFYFRETRGNYHAIHYAN